MRKIAFKLTLIALFTISLSLYGQNESHTTNKIKSNSISLNLIGAPADPSREIILTVFLSNKEFGKLLAGSRN
jgi:hypothetical protein